MNNNKSLPIILGVLLTACVLMLAVVVPILLFRAQDGALFSAPHTYPQKAGTLRFHPEDIPLIRSLYQREEARNTPEEYHTEVLITRSKSENATLLPRISEYVEQLNNSNVISSSMRDYIIDHMLVRDTVNFSRTIDQRGFESITCNLGSNTLSSYYLGFSIDVSTGYLLALDWHLPPTAPTGGLNLDWMLEAYTHYLGLDITSDWQGAPAKQTIEKNDADGTLNTHSMATRRSELLKLEENCTTYISEDGVGIYLYIVSFQHAPAAAPKTISLPNEDVSTNFMLVEEQLPTAQEQAP